MKNNLVLKFTVKNKTDFLKRFIRSKKYTFISFKCSSKSIFDIQIEFFDLDPKQIIDIVKLYQSVIYKK